MILAVQIVTRRPVPHVGRVKQDAINRLAGLPATPVRPGATSRPARLLATPARLNAIRIPARRAGQIAISKRATLAGRIASVYAQRTIPTSLPAGLAASSRRYF